MQYAVDLNKAEHTWENSPTVDSIEYEIKGHRVMIEFFDYGYPMWGEHFSPKGTDLRERIFFDGKRIYKWPDVIGCENIKEWLPKNITQKLWREKLSEHLDILKGRNNDQAIND